MVVLHRKATQQQPSCRNTCWNAQVTESEPTFQKITRNRQRVFVDARHDWSCSHNHGIPTTTHTRPWAPTNKPPPSSFLCLHVLIVPPAPPPPIPPGVSCMYPDVCAVYFWWEKEQIDRKKDGTDGLNQREETIRKGWGSGWWGVKGWGLLKETGLI